MTLNDYKNNKKQNQATRMQFAIVAITTIGISILMLSLNPAEAVLYYPPSRADWEGHDSAKGTSSTLDITNPSVPIPGTDWWWARSFIYEGVFVDDPVKGAMGAGWSKYMPLGSSTAVKKYVVYNYDVAAASQSYSFGSSTSGSTTNNKVEYTSGGCWNRLTGGVTYNACVTGMIQGHAKYYTSESHSANTVPGHFNPNQYKDAGGTWKDFSQNSQPYYCHADYSIERLFSGNVFKTSTLASANSCTGAGGGFSDSNTLPG